MRYRLKEISLTLPGRVIQIGEVVTEEDVPLEILEARRVAGTAEIFTDQGEVSPQLEAAIAAYNEAAAAFGRCAVLVIDAGEQGSDLDAELAYDTLREPPAPLLELMGKERSLQDRVRALRDAREAAAHQALTNSADGGSTASAAGGTDDMASGSQGGGGDDPPPPGNQGAEGATADAPQPNAGTDGDAGAAAPAEPAAQADEAKQPAPRGGSRRRS